MYPDLTGWETTRDTLSAYAKIVGAIPRALAEPHPKWWHISLKVSAEGPQTDAIPFGESSFTVRMDLVKHAIVIDTAGGGSRHVDLTSGTSARALGEQVLEALAKLSIRADLDRSKFADDDPRAYDEEMAKKYLQALVAIDRALKQQKSRISGQTGPVQLWPHHFDLAFEWFGTKMVEHEQDGEKSELPSQINFGFSPGDGSHPAPYFYSNPWPFGEALLEQHLPSGARWFTDSWKGSLMPYAYLAGKGDAEYMLLDYYQAIYEAASPSLME